MHRTAFAVASAVALTNPFASAQITVEDDVIFGAESITRDAQQDLDFLDVPLSVGRSYNDVSGQFGPGGDFEGWRHATLEEVITLVNNWGFGPSVPFPSPGDTSGLVNSDSSGTSLAQLASRLGITFVLPGSGSFTFGLVELRDGGTLLPNIALTGSGFSWADYPPGSVANDAITGHFLVRTVPAPGALALLAGAGLAVLRRRRA